MSTVSADSRLAPQSHSEQRRTASLLSMGWLLTWMALWTPSLPLNLYLKNTLHLGAGAIAAFGLVAGFASYVKPIAGLLSDNLTLFGTRRKHYLLLSTLLGGICWLLVGVLPKTYSVLLFMQAMIMAMVMVASTALGGLLVDSGKRNNTVGRLSSQRYGINNLTTLIVGPLGGYLASRTFGLTIGICAACLILLAPLVALFLHEERTEPNARSKSGSWSNVGQQLKNTLASRPLWWGLAMCCLLNIAPGFGTPLLFYQQDTLKFTPQFMGNLSILSGGSGLIAAALYFRFCSRVTLRRLLTLGIALSVIGTLFYLFYQSTLTAALIEISTGFVSTLAILPLWNLCGRATPRGNEALGYSLMMSVCNLMAALSNTLGSWFFEHLHWNFKNLVWLNAGTTALVLLIVPLLPATLMDPRDGD